jgi:hypothetical protein
MSKKHMGSSIDEFLKEEGILEEAQAQAIKEVVLGGSHSWPPRYDRAGVAKNEKQALEAGKRALLVPYIAKPRWPWTTRMANPILRLRPLPPPLWAPQR